MWLIGAIPVIIGIVLYMVDIRGAAQVNSVKIENIEKRHQLFEQDLKIELRRLSDKVDVLLERNIRQ